MSRELVIGVNRKWRSDQTDAIDPTETLSDRLEPVVSMVTRGFCDVSDSTAANEKERRTNRHVS
jgi:hypothetical protein